MTFPDIPGNNGEYPTFNSSAPSRRQEQCFRDSFNRFAYREEVKTVLNHGYSCSSLLKTPFPAALTRKTGNKPGINLTLPEFSKQAYS